MNDVLMSPGKSRTADVAFEDLLLVLFAIWTTTGHISFFNGLTLAQYWLLAATFSTAGLIIYCIVPRSGVVLSGQCVAESGRAGKRLIGWLAILFGVVLALCLNRPDADDEHYLGLALTALDNAGRPFQSLDVWSFYPVGYALSCYDFLRAGFSWLTGVPLLVSYYFFWPAVIAAMTVAYQCRLLNLLGVRSLACSLLVFFIVMLAWGDVHRTPPNFGFVRFFQGKGALIWVTIPSALYHWLRFVEYSDGRSLFLLLCAIIGGIGFSPTGVPTGVLLIGLFCVATFACRQHWRRRWKLISSLASIAIYPIVLGVIMKYSSDYYLPRIPIEDDLAAENWTMIQYVLGQDFRGLVALLCAIGLPVFLAASRARPLFVNYSILYILLLAFPWSSEILRLLSYSTFAWRWLYIVPFVFAMVVFADRVVGRFRSPVVKTSLAVTMVAIFVAGSPRFVVSDQNGTHFGPPAFKLANEREIFLWPYNASATIAGLWLTSPTSGVRY